MKTSKNLRTTASRFGVRFSLRTLLIVITVSCILAAYLANGALKQGRAIRHFHTVAANRTGPRTVTVMYRVRGEDNYWRPKIAWWQRPLSYILGDEAFGNPVGIDCTNTQVTDDDLRYLWLLPNVEYLFISNTKITTAGLRHLRACPRLRHLRADGTAITDDDLAVISQLTNLEVLTVRKTAVTDEGLQHLSQLPKLQSVMLMDTQVTEDGCHQLQKALPQCDIAKDPNYVRGSLQVPKW